MNSAVDHRSMTGDVEVSLVVETYTHSEGSAPGRLGRSLAAAVQMVSDHGRGEVLVTDIGGDPDVAALIEREFPGAIRVDATGLDYDGAKMKAAAAAHGDYVLYLDGDCLPVPNWLTYHLDQLRADGTAATGGFTRYEGGYIAALCTILDFGFLLPRGSRILDCYASNNCGFRRQVLVEEIPIPEGPLRCRCHAHAQALRRGGKPVVMVPPAEVLHEYQPFFRERFRQGYDVVAGYWTDPKLRGAGWLRVGPLAAPAFYARTVIFDWARLLRGYRDLGLRRWQAVLGLPLFPLFRLVDLAGIVKALTSRERKALTHEPG